MQVWCQWSWQCMWGEVLECSDQHWMHAWLLPLRWLLQKSGEDEVISRVFVNVNGLVSVLHAYFVVFCMILNIIIRYLLLQNKEDLKKDHRFHILILRRCPARLVSFDLRMDILNTYFSENSLVDPKVKNSTSLESLCLCAFMEYVSSFDLHLCIGSSCLVL